MKRKGLLKRCIALTIGVITTLTASGLVACGMQDSQTSTNSQDEKFCAVIINGNEAVEVAYNSKVSELFADLPKCTIVSATNATTGVPVALDSAVTQDMILTVSYTVEHKYENGECKYCDEVCEQHNWIDGVCSICATSCTHSSWQDFTCEVCTVSTTTTYNACTAVTDMKAYGSATGEEWKNTTDGLTYEQTKTAGGKNGDFLRVHIGKNENGVGVYWVGITIAPTLTLEQITLLKAMGYKKLSVDYYFEHVGGAKADVKLVYAGKVYEYGIDYNGPGYVATHQREGKTVGEWHNFTVNINAIITNYEGLANGTKYLMLIINYKDYLDQAYTPQLGYGHFYTYFSNMQFIK